MNMIIQILKYGWVMLCRKHGQYFATECQNVFFPEWIHFVQTSQT